MSEPTDEQWVIISGDEWTANASWQNTPGQSWYYAHANGDGCLEYERWFNEPREWQQEQSHDKQMYDQIHICDLDDEIARLTALRDALRVHFAQAREKGAA